MQKTGGISVSAQAILLSFVLIKMKFRVKFGALPCVVPFSALTTFGETFPR
jgi:hypothetical protein